MKIIFLDIDGVLALNHKERIPNGIGKKPIK